MDAGEAVHALSQICAGETLRSTVSQKSRGRRILHGDLRVSGVSIELFDSTSQPWIEPSRLGEPRTLQLCLNLTGSALLRHDTKPLAIGPLMACFYCTGNRGLQAEREPGQRHRFITITLSRSFLKSCLASCNGALDRTVEQFLQNPRLASPGTAIRLSPDQEKVAAQLAHPPVPFAARDLWYQGKVLELIASLFFARPDSDELFCDHQKRVARERVDRVVSLLRDRLAEPPSLDEIGRSVGCSPFYLSRTFSQQMGMTISQYQRKVRIERAAELLRTGKFNVTEAALEVGYSSLSHFSQAFCQEMGCCPALYPPKEKSR